MARYGQGQFRIDDSVHDLSAFSAIHAGLSVMCPHCHGTFMIQREALNEHHAKASRRRPLLLGQPRSCPYCDGEAVFPKELGWLSDVRPGVMDF